MNGNGKVLTVIDRLLADEPIAICQSIGSFRNVRELGL